VEAVEMAEQNALRPVRVFFSYSHRDEELLNELEQGLSLLKRQSFIAGWHDRRIGTGEDWNGAIDRNLEEAEIILLLVSPAFMASDYCWDVEVKRAMERHERREAQVIPVIMRPVDWQEAPFSRLQVLPKDGKPVTRWEDRDEAYLDISRGIRRAVEEINLRTARVPKKVQADGGRAAEAGFHLPTFHRGGVVPPPFFVDREAELAEAERIICSGQSILLSGPLRWGKTSFGKKLIHNLMGEPVDERKRILCGYLNLQQCPDLSPESFLEHTVLNMMGEIARHVFGCKSWTLYESDPTQANPSLKGDDVFTDFVNLYRLVEQRSHSRGDMHPAHLRSQEFVYFVNELMNLIRRKGWTDFFIFYDEANHLPKKFSVELLNGNIEALDSTGMVSMYAANPAAADTFMPLQDFFGYHIGLKPFGEVIHLFRLHALYYFGNPDRVDELPIQPNAAQLLWDLSQGIPYRIQLLADGSFKLAFEQRAGRVEQAHILRAFEELATEKPGEFRAGGAPTGPGS
jgi:hypothetical protein